MQHPILRLALLATAAASTLLAAPASAHAQGEWRIVIHGGAGTLSRKDMTPEMETAYRASLKAALDAGKAVLAAGGSAEDAVTAAITRLEDDEKFNAGKGAVFTWDGGHSLDASIMTGQDRAAGAVAGVTTVRNPILLAKAVKDHSDHVLLSGAGAEDFAATQGLERVAPTWFDTPARREALERMKAKKLSAIDVDYKFGTVGAVALDKAGHVAAGTSTGGMTGKRWGRVGDSPLIGSGTYADDKVCAVSATGWGEYFIRASVARTICARMEFKGESAQAAADAVMADVGRMGGDGGVIVLAPNGDTVFSFNSDGMYRARASSQGSEEVAIHGDE